MNLYLRFADNRLCLEPFLDVLRGLRPEWMAVALALILAAYVVRATRWRVMIRPMAPQATVWEMTVATFIGFTAVVLFGRAGEPVRPYLIARKYGSGASPARSPLGSWNAFWIC